MARRRQDRRGADAARGRAHRRDRLQSGRPLAAGRAPRRRPGDAGAHSLSVHGRGTRCTRSPTEYVPYDLDISPDGRLLSASMSDVNGDQFLRVWELDRLLAGRPDAAVASSASGSRSRRASSSRRDGRYLYGSSYYTGVSNIFRYEVATGDDRGGLERRNGLLPPGAARRRPAGRARLHGRGLRSRDHRAAPAQGRQRDHVPRRRGRREVPGGQDLAGAAAEHGRRREAGHAARAPTCRCASLALENAYPGAAGLQELGRASATTSTSRIRCSFASLGITAAYTPSSEPAQRTSAATSTSPAATSVWRGGAVVEPVGLLRPVRARPSAAARATRRSSATTGSLIYDEPRRLDAQLRRRLLRQDRHAAERAERRARPSRGS